MTDRQMDGQTDGGDCNIPIAFFKKCGDNNMDPDCSQGSRLIRVHIVCSHEKI